MLYLTEQWWAWISFGFTLGVLEILAPAYIFLGFALAALAMGVIVALGIGMTLAMKLFAFAALSLLSWLALRRLFSRPGENSRYFDRDVNED